MGLTKWEFHFLYEITGVPFNACSGSSVSAHVDIYNSHTNTWTSLPNGLGEARHFLASATLPCGLVFFAGGSTGVRAYVRGARLCVFEPFIFHLKLVSALITGVFKCAFKQRAATELSSYVDIYDSIANSWTRLPNRLGQARNNLKGASLSSLVIFAGGSWNTGILLHFDCLFNSPHIWGTVDGYSGSKYVDIYNASSNRWIQLPEGLTLGRTELGSASLQSGLVFFAGGCLSSSNLQTAFVDIYNASNNIWSRIPNGLGLARHRVEGASLPSGLVFFAGGSVNGDSGQAYVDMYNSFTGTWTRFPTGLSQARRYLAAVSLPSGLVFFAGGNRGMACSYFQISQIYFFIVVWISFIAFCLSYSSALTCDQ
jgi:hypothetical protein